MILFLQFGSGFREIDTLVGWVIFLCPPCLAENASTPTNTVGIDDLIQVTILKYPNSIVWTCVTNTPLARTEQHHHVDVLFSIIIIITIIIVCPNSLDVALFRLESFGFRLYSGNKQQ